MTEVSLQQVDDYRWEIPIQGMMRVKGKIFANKRLANLLKKDSAPHQVMNVATLPGIVVNSLAMPDIHQGYGFPIGGVAAMEFETGVISPGGVGYDINCGVRLIKTNLFYNGVVKQLPNLMKEIYNAIPTGVGSKGAIHKLSPLDLDGIITSGAKWTLENDFGDEKDLEYTEENGCISNANPDDISIKAKARGLEQLGTLGSGNHFVEIGSVQEIFTLNEANVLGLEKDQIIILIHSGSRGLGHQVCDDYIKVMKMKQKQLDFSLPDSNLISAYVTSDIGKKYYSAMNGAANFAWANRQVIMSLVKKALLKSLSIREADLGFSLVYDVCHNIAKIEHHEVAGKMMKLCVHRKGATRAFPPQHSAIPEKYRDIGQPVIVPGDMGRYSYLCLGTEKSMHETFGSSCHGAGRMMSRKETMRTSTANKVLAEMKKSNIIVYSATKETLVEEMSEAYKDVTEVVDTMVNCGLLKKVAKTKPLGVIKG